MNGIGMNDLISKQTAISAFADMRDGYPKCTGEVYSDVDICKVLTELPSTQPEQPFEIQEILDYLDTALHPIISPEHWNVYSELHDMISTLPSAQPEETCDTCKHSPFGDSRCEECRVGRMSYPSYYERRTDD